jgi:hypothetical protein
MGYSKKNSAYKSEEVDIDNSPVVKEEDKKEINKEVRFEEEDNKKEIENKVMFEEEDKEVRFEEEDKKEINKEVRFEEYENKTTSVEELENENVVNVDWKKQVKIKDIREGYIESYEGDDNFRGYVNDMNMKREDNSVDGVIYSVIDVLEHLNKRMMYIENKMNASYERDHNNYFNYDKVLMQMSSELNI